MTLGLSGSVNHTEANVHELSAQVQSRSASRFLEDPCRGLSTYLG
jgi:hypothetical protein